MASIKITAVLQSDVSSKFNDEAIRQQILTVLDIAQDIIDNATFVFICRMHPKGYKNESWIVKGEPYHTILVPYEQVLRFSVDQVTQLCADLAIQRIIRPNGPKNSAAPQAQSRRKSPSGAGDH